MSEQTTPSREWRLKAALRADLDQIKREASDEPYVEPDHLDDLLGIDPNDLSDRLAGRAVEYRSQRDDLALRLNRARVYLQRRERRGSVVLPRELLAILESVHGRPEEGS